MKLFILLFLVTTFSFSQEINPETDKITYHDSIGNETSKELCQYYKISTKNLTNPDETISKLFYILGKIKETGRIYSQKNGTSGEIITYYKNGNKKSVVNYISKKEIYFSSWYENGQKEEEFYNDGLSNLEYDGLIRKNYWDKNGKQLLVNGEGLLSINDEFILYSTGAISKGQKNGVWNGKSKENASNGKPFTFREVYENGKLISGESTDTEGKCVEYTKVKVTPEPLLGMEHFYKFISRNYIVPEFDKPTKGKVLIGFVIEKTGEITDIKIIQDLGFGSGLYGIQVIKKYNQLWKVALLRGYPVRVSYMLPITIDTTFE